MEIGAQWAGNATRQWFLSRKLNENLRTMLRPTSSDRSKDFARERFSEYVVALLICRRVGRNLKRGLLDEWARQDAMLESLERRLRQSAL